MDKKELIKQAALSLFRQSGQVTIREISKKSGMNVASINYYFGSKDKLFDELEESLIFEIQCILQKIINQSNNLDQQRELFINELYTLAKSSPGFFKFIVSLFTTDNHFKRLLFMTKEFAKDEYKNFIGNMIKESTKITDEVEINNRIAIFFTSLTVSVITAEAINYPHHGNEQMISRFIDKDHFTSYCNTLFDIILK